MKMLSDSLSIFLTCSIFWATQWPTMEAAGGSSLYYEPDPFTCKRYSYFPDAMVSPASLPRFPFFPLTNGSPPVAMPSTHAAESNELVSCESQLYYIEACFQDIVNVFLTNKLEIGPACCKSVTAITQAFNKFAPILGALFADSCMGRIATIGLGSTASFLGVSNLWLTTVILLPQASPPPCNPCCKSATAGHVAILISALFFKSIRAGDIRPCSMPFVYVWNIGYGTCAFLMLLSTLAFYIASPFYIKQKASTSIFTGVEFTVPSDSLKFMNKACIIVNAEEEIGSDGLDLNPWNICTVQKLEEFKALLKVIPLWSTGIVIAIAGNQYSFPMLQASTMNRHLFGGFHMLAASLTVIVYITSVLY
ncbi:Detected protein of unknown function [Hibiscus syriacus]|uniref:Prolamin-like domain-containing protein n=1 Tax=Hibiscus syriacus TaxID=106335 RepID=A0A6A2ZBY3_HIBSY|nr:Detected protein of unknown function [Hibiscus syriacus]